MNRAEALAERQARGHRRLRAHVLQRRLASSPEAIYQSLRRRRERLEERLREESCSSAAATARRHAAATLPALTPTTSTTSKRRPTPRSRQLEEEVVDQATAARTIAELEAEIATLQRLGERWRSTCAAAARTEVGGAARRDLRRMTTREIVATIRQRIPRRKAHASSPSTATRSNYLEQTHHDPARRSRGGRRDPRRRGREERRKAQEAFTHDPDVQVLSPPTPPARA